MPTADPSPALARPFPPRPPPPNPRPLLPRTPVLSMVYTNSQSSIDDDLVESIRWEGGWVGWGALGFGLWAGWSWVGIGLAAASGQARVGGCARAWGHRQIAEGGLRRTPRTCEGQAVSRTQARLLHQPAWSLRLSLLKASKR